MANVKPAVASCLLLYVIGGGRTPGRRVQVFG